MGFKHCPVGHFGHVQDVPSSFGTVGWKGQWNVKDNQVLYGGTLRTYL